MNSNIINYLPENSKQLPINFYTVSNRYHEQAISRPLGQREFNQILLVIGGTGELKCQGKTYELKKGCAFFTSSTVPVEYRGKHELITAFLTANGSAIEELCDYYDCKDFFFCEHLNTEKYLSEIDRIISEYYEHKRESVLSAMVYNFYVDFFEETRPSDIDVCEKISLYIEKNFKEKITLEALSKQFNISMSKMCHDFKKRFSCSVINYVLDLRLTYARNYLQSNRNARTVDAASCCGFDDVSYFCRAYKKKFSKTPLEDKRFLDSVID